MSVFTRKQNSLKFFRFMTFLIRYSVIIGSFSTRNTGQR